MNELYNIICKLEDMCNRDKYRSVTLTYDNIYSMKMAIQNVPDTIKMLRNDNDKLEKENTQYKQKIEELEKTKFDLLQSNKSLKSDIEDLTSVLSKLKERNVR